MKKFEYTQDKCQSKKDGAIFAEPRQAPLDMDKITVDVSVNISPIRLNPSHCHVAPEFIALEQEVWGPASISYGERSLDQSLVHYFLTGEVQQSLPDIKQESFLWWLGFLAQQDNIEQAKNFVMQFRNHTKLRSLRKAIVQWFFHDETSKQEVECLFLHPYFELVLEHIIRPILEDNTHQAGEKIAKALIASSAFVQKQSDLDALLRCLKS